MSTLYGKGGGGAPWCIESAAPALTAGARQATMAWGVEARVPFLDKDFMEVVMSLDPDSKLIRKGQVPPPPCHTRCCRSAAHSMLQVSRCAFSVTVGDERVLCCLAQETQFIEKWVMRAAFDCDGPDGEKYLPQEVLFRFRPSPVLSGHVSSFPPQEMGARHVTTDLEAVLYGGKVRRVRPRPGAGPDGPARSRSTFDVEVDV